MKKYKLDKLISCTIFVTLIFFIFLPLKNIVRADQYCASASCGPCEAKAGNSNIKTRICSCGGNGWEEDCGGGGGSSSDGGGGSSSTGGNPPAIIPPPENAATAGRFSQTVNLPAGSYTLTVKARGTLVKGGGSFVTVSGGHVVALILIPETADFATYSVPFSATAGTYAVKIVVEDGSEAYFDLVSIKGGATEYVNNPDFKIVKSSPQTISLDEPDNWGDGDNKMGYYYGRATASAALLAAQSSANSSSSTSTSTISAAVKLNLKLKLQGVTTKPKVADAIKVKVKLGGGGMAAATDYQTVDFNVGADGVWSGTAGFNVPPGNTYKVYIKGPKHLQKKVCDTSPSESAGGTYHCGDGKVSIVAGDNTLDFSKILMLVGDLPENGNQNGVVDAYDTGYIRQHLQSSKPDELKIGDLNYDGNIDGQDFSLVLASLSIKYDEE